jgi:hypothetical protein
MAVNGFPEGVNAGPVDYDLARLTWASMSRANCCDPDSDIGHFAQGLVAGMLEHAAGIDSETADRMTRAARASAAVLHTGELSNGRSE